MVTRNGADLIDASVVGVFGLVKVAVSQARARVIGRVGLNGDAFVKPFLKMRMLRLDTVGNNTHRRATIYFFKSLENWSQESFVAIDCAHIVNPESDDRFDTHFAYPLWGHEFGKGKIRIIGIAIIIQIGQTVAM